MILKLLFSICSIFFYGCISYAQVKDSSTAITDTASKTSAKPPKQKEIKKLEDPLLALPAELIYRMKRMIPNELLVIDERFVRNEKRVDDNGEEYEVTVTVRMGFSQDMITGIVKEVPLYQSAEREANLLYVKIPIKFCCITPIDDTLHTKQHCGKMSELNGLEDSSHCKAWVQKDEAQAEAENIAGFGKTGGSKTTSKKKGANVSGKTSIDGGEGFGKPVPKGKSSKKGKTSTENDAEITDSSGNVVKQITTNSKNKKGTKTAVEKPNPDSTDANNNKEEFGKPSPKDKKKKPIDKKPVTNNDGYNVPNYREEKVIDSSNQPEKKAPVKAKEIKTKPIKKEEIKKKETNEDEGFGKPAPKDKNKKTSKGNITQKDTSNLETKEPLKAADTTGVKKN